MAEPKAPIECSIVIVSYNTRELLMRCIESAQAAANGIPHEIIVVDNASHDGSPEAVSEHFPEVHLLQNRHNLGFAAANNRAFAIAGGKHVVLLNPDALLEPDVLTRAIEQMKAHPDVALGGGLLIGRNGNPEPSARQFPSLLNEFLALSGLAARFASSRFFGKADRTWADPRQAAFVDWVPGAFAIIRRDALEQAAGFDERFFLYYEEVDLCRRLKAQGYRIAYWPDLVVPHIGGASARSVRHTGMAEHGNQLLLWRTRSALLYWRKHHGWTGAWLAARMESLWFGLREFKNRHREEKRRQSTQRIDTLRQAWHETLGGRVCPPRPW